MKLDTRSSERNSLRADLKAGRLAHQAVHQAKLAYQFSPNAYSFECLSAVLRLIQQLKELELLRNEAGERRSQSSSSPQPLNQ
jgi:hypothetical protein